MLEIIRLEGLAQDDSFVSRDVHLLQVLPLPLLWFVYLHVYWFFVA
jgi:hypothetical protein